MSSKLIPGFTSRYYDYGSNDADLVVNWNNWNPNLLDPNHPMFYRALYPTYGASYYSKQEQERNPADLPISEVRVGDITKKMGGDLMTILGETITFKANAATFTRGTRGFTLGVLFIISSIVVLIFSRAK